MAVRTTTEYRKLSRPETHFRKDCLADIRAIGYLATAIPDSRQLLGDKGEPDIRFAGRGRIGFLECKFPVNLNGDVELSLAQMRWREEIMKPILAKKAQPKIGFNWAMGKSLFYGIGTPENWREIMEALS